MSQKETYMNSRQFPVALFLTALILTGAVHAQTSPLANRISAHSQLSPFADRTISRSQLASTPNPFNPAPFQKHLAPLSGQVQFLLSTRGRQFAASHPNVHGWLVREGVNLSGARTPTLPSAVANSGSGATPQTLASTCNASSGAKFNLEPFHGMREIGIPLPQNQTSVDFIPDGGVGGNDLVVGGANDYRGLIEPEAAGFSGVVPPHAWGFSASGYYVHRAGPDCGSNFEGGLPHLVYSPTREILFGMGDPVIAVDSTRKLVYGADLRFGLTVSAIGLFRTTTTKLNSAAACPDGTHLTDASGNDTVAAGCWPTSMVVAPDTTPSDLLDKPHLRVDERSKGTGAGDIYLTYTWFANNASVIQLVVCPANFNSILDCSNPRTVSHPNDANTQFSHIAVRPDGVVTISYVNFEVFSEPEGNPFVVEQSNIKLVTCTPNGAPNPPTCSLPSLVAQEMRPIPLQARIAEQGFPVATYPTHDQRFNPATGQYEEFVVWTRCATSGIFPVGNGKFFDWIQCPESKIVMSHSTGESGPAMNWSSPLPLDTGPHDQFFPWVRTDHDKNTVQVIYYSSENDRSGHLLQVMENEVVPGNYSSGTPQVLTKTQINPSADPILGDADPNFGDYIGMAAKNGHAYVHFTGTNFPQTFGGAAVSGQNNQLTSFTY